MTTAARPTFDSAKGGSGRGEKDLSALTRQYSSRDLPSHTKLKYRETGQGTEEERRNKDFRRELEEREKTVGSKSSKSEVPKLDSSLGQPASKRTKSEPAPNLDADDPIDLSDEDSDSDSSEDEDDTAALMAELQKIKRERAAEAQKKEAEKRIEEERIRAENILSGNPLLNYGTSGTATKSDMKVKRRWDEDVVFKNCARVDDGSGKKTFINDCLRSEFHRKFMEKYIK